MENSGTFKNIIIIILIAVAGYFSYSAYNAEDQLSAQTAEIKNLNGQIATLNQKVTDYEKADDLDGGVGHPGRRNAGLRPI